MENQLHSGIGIASFILGLTSGVLIFLLILVASILEASTSGGLSDDSVAATMIGLFILALLGAALLGVGLGVGGLLQKERKKIFAILGTVFSSVSSLATIFIIMLGLLAG